MRILDLESLAVFRTVAREGGVVRAAARLHRVQSGVTTRVKQLEEHLGVGLLRRQGRGVALTPAGEALLVHAERLLGLAEQAERELRAGGVVGTFRLGALESAAGARLPPLLSRFHARHPDVVLELQTGTTGALLRRLDRYELDAAFVSEPFDAPALHTRPVFEERLVLVTGADHPPVRRAADLGRTTLISFARGCSYRRRLEEWLGAGGVLPDRTLELGSYHAIVACVAAGTGCAVVPESVLGTTMAGPSLRRHPWPARWARSRTHLAWRGDPTPQVSALLDLLLPAGAVAGA